MIISLYVMLHRQLKCANFISEISCLVNTQYRTQMDTKNTCTIPKNQSSLPSSQTLQLAIQQKPITNAILNTQHQVDPIEIQVLQYLTKIYTE